MINGTEPHEIRICERCWTVVEDDEPYVALSHIDHALPDGTIVWRDAYLHAVGATTGRTAWTLTDLCPV